VIDHLEGGLNPHVRTTNGTLYRTFTKT
jgi:hypothetical protein